MIISRIAFIKAVDAILGPGLCWMLGRISFLARSAPSNPAAVPANIRRILLIRPGGIGDMIVLLPVVRELGRRFPDAEIDLVCEKRNMAVLELGGLKKNALVYDTGPIRFLVRLLKQPYDIAVDTEQFHHFSAVFAFFSRARIRIGFKINPRRNPLYTHLINYSPDGPEGQQFMKLLEPLGIEDAAARPLTGALAELPDMSPPDAAELAEALPVTFAVIHPGSSMVYKLWASGNFASLAGKLRLEHGLGIVLVGDRNDVQTCDRVQREMRDAGADCVSLAGKLELTANAWLIRRARLFIGTDSGLAHLAVAVGVPAVVLFGPTDHLKWGHQDSTHAVVKCELPCAPCFIFGYHKPCRTIACMKQISVDRVFAACRRVLAE